jgi:predicted glycosyltransferase involved in capsule biosynthesis
VDNGSKKMLKKEWVESFGENFYYEYFPTQSVSPVEAINYHVERARTQYVMCLIDGARMFSPGIIANTFHMIKTFTDPFIFTISMHIGKKIQNIAIADGYNQDKEDQLIDSIDWKRNGYLLFSISTLASSSKKGFLTTPNESNCFTMKRRSFLSLGGFEERFCSKGGGLANLDFFKRAISQNAIVPIMLIGEATFHQFHGGVATNVSLDDHPWNDFNAEYRTIHGEDYRWNESDIFSPILFGHIPTELRPKIGEI